MALLGTAGGGVCRSGICGSLAFVEILAFVDVRVGGVGGGARPAPRTGGGGGGARLCWLGEPPSKIDSDERFGTRALFSLMNFFITLMVFLSFIWSSVIPAF